MPTTLAVAALALATAAETADATTEPSTTELVADAAAFKKAARPLIREYISVGGQGESRLSSISNMIRHRWAAHPRIVPVFSPA